MPLAPLGGTKFLWIRKKKKDENKLKERREPKNAGMRKEFDLAKKAEMTETLRATQAGMPAIDFKIENLRRIARLGKLKK